MSLCSLGNDEDCLLNTDCDVSCVTTSPTVLYLHSKTNLLKEKENKENLDSSNNGIEERPDIEEHACNENRPFICNICYKSYKRSSHLKVHLHTHKNEKPHVCKVCNKSFYHPYSLKQHVQIHGNEPKFSCKFCNKTFSVRRYYTRHIARHTSSNYECDACDFRCFKLKEINEHTKAHNVGYHTCIKCDRLFCQENSKNHHECLKSDMRQYSCEFCSKTFKKFWDLDLHLSTHTDARPFVCHICDRSFKYKQSIKTHMKLHTGENLYVCNICDKPFTTKQYFKKHMETHVDKTNQHSENIENLSDNVSQGLENIESNPSEKSYTCPTCLRQFFDWNTLRCHLRIHESKSQVVKIGYLNIESPINLKQLIYFVPGKNIKHVCDICLKGFKRKYAFTQHYRIHTGERPFACDMCSWRFTSKCDLQRHVRIHTGERKYVCERCNKRYTRKHYLTAHVQICSRVNNRAPKTPQMCKIVSVQSGFQDST